LPFPLLVPAIIGASTIVGLASPFFLPKTEQEKATIELNEKLTEGNFTIVKNQKDIKVPSFTSNLTNQINEIKETYLDNPKYQSLIIIAVIAFIVMFLVLR